jgi:cation transport ATPase
VNIVGRYIVVKHCAVSCCAPSDKIVEMLNKQHLGVSIQEIHASSPENEAKTEAIDLAPLANVAAVWTLFLAGLICGFLSPAVPPAAPMVLYLLSTAGGIAPVVKQSLISLCIRRTVDIHILLVVAVAGALASRDFFDASLVVSLFITSELAEATIMTKV